MGASEQQRVDLGIDGRCEQPLGEHVHLWGVELAPLHELHEPRARQRHQFAIVGKRMLVGTRGDRAHGADDPNPARHGGIQRSPRPRLHHADHGHVETIPKGLQCRRSRRVAGDHQHLRPTALDEFPGDLVREARHLPERPRAVGVAGGVAEVDELLTGQQVHHGARHGEPSEA